ncbi:hypothetical protein PR202_ga13458 [Eleusine coracana subsp. coracana]|uniref:Uncharacterized protein n=1 Tax=Eleusine coracana subsp. coracana TaxID=191504 RepID=A0AAV5CEC0_ELECO|nr:hypothetical protein PR202_ga13458 [Eleusine coracana subsp. coracana]
MPDAKSASGLRMGHNGLKAVPLRGMEDGMRNDLKKDAVSLEVDKSSIGIGVDEDLGGGPALTGKKRKDLTGDSADVNGPVTKRMLRSDAMKLRAGAETACGVAVEVGKRVCLDRKQCEALVEADRHGLLMADTCNDEEYKEVVNVSESGVSEESSRRAEDNVEISGDAAMEFAPGNGLGTQGSTAELDDKSIKSDEKISVITHNDHSDSIAGTSSLSFDESQANKVGHVSFQGEVIDPSTVTNDDKMSTGLCRVNPSGKSEYVELEDAVVCTEGVVLRCGDQKVEEHSHVDDVHNEETSVSLTENGTCTVDNHNDLTESTKDGRGTWNEPKDASTPDIVFTRRKSITRKTGEAKQDKCEEDLRVEKRVTRSATVRYREVCGGSCKSKTIKNESTVGSKERKGDVIAHYTRKVSSTVSPMAHHAELVKCNTSTKKQTVKEKVADQRDSCADGNVDHVNTTVNEVSKDETKITLKSQPLMTCVGVVKKITKAVVPAMDQNISGSAITEKNDTEHTDSEGVKSENKTRVQQSVGQKIVAGMNRIMGSGLDKTARRSTIAMSSRKRTRNTPSDTELEQSNKSARDEHTGKNCDLENRRILRERQNRAQLVSSCRSSSRSNRNVCKLSQDESGDDETGSDTSYRKTRSRQRRGAAPRVIKEEDDSSDSEEVITVRKNRRKRKDSEHKQRVESRLRLGKPVLAKSESSSFSQHAENEEMEVQEDKGKASILGSASPSEQINTGSRIEQKQKISAQIKEILVNAGWKIDQRPRNGRNYMDSVYIPPSGKGSYWSVTKAYAVFLEGVESEQKDSVSSLGKEHASSTPGCTLTENDLSTLKRVVVNGRRTKVELQKLRKKKNIMLKKLKKSKGKLKEKKKKITNSRRLHLGNERKKRGGCALLARSSNKESGNNDDGFVPYKWKRSIISWLIDLDVLSVNSKLKCMDDCHSEVLLQGTVTRDGINCSCCTKILTVHEFVVHAGGEVKKSFRNILVDELDIDLLHCLINAWNKQSEKEKQAFFPISTEGDDRMMTHVALPSDNWCCANCSCKFCHEHSSHDAEDNAGVDSSLRTCSQCEEKYHQACSHEIDSVTCDSDQSDILFCQHSCRLLSKELRSLLAVKKDLGPDYSCRVIQRIHEDVPETVLALDTRFECNSKIAIAFSLMDECFRPIVDQRTGINLIRNVVYSCGLFFVWKQATMILSSLNVEKLIIPAITELVDTWTSKFGFSPLEDSEKQEVKSISIERPFYTTDDVFFANKTGKPSNVANKDSLCSVASVDPMWIVDSNKNADAILATMIFHSNNFLP